MRFGSSERRCGGEARNTNADQRRKEPCEDGDAEERQTVVGENWIFKEEENSTGKTDENEGWDFSSDEIFSSDTQEFFEFTVHTW